MKRPIILLTGGGTAGHVSVNEALIPVFQERGYEVHYIGSHDGIEKELIGKRFPDVTYHAIQSGKLRRYFSVKNFTDPFRVGVGLLQALSVIRKLKPELIFSKGGFVSVPVALAGQIARIPVVIHESDVTPGLANKLAVPFATHVFTVFEQTLKYLPQNKSTCSGAVIRPELFTGVKELGLKRVGFSGSKSVLIVMGGSQGSKLLNDALRNELDVITETFDVIHLCGKGHLDTSLNAHRHYKQFEYVTTELPHLLAASDFAISRAGSNAIFELLALEKPMLLVPLSAAKSRGDQILNAKYFKSLGLAYVLEEEEIAVRPLSTELLALKKDEQQLKTHMKNNEGPKTPEEMVELIMTYKK
ncbi:undecaprenyldiphospho-muramoylpentapeptide beta-N-acetylglucosaminyltransferase [Sporosarcina pasteurii]|uniref:UDP-N-acetylglucosamine--N-acetylmuramyl-(pentapeptide) pyrophosphoryl-undecaprenol N-acetylglucosamine transferase n=1 Tax=Sporosarcina pasteurii TaxID=1474 RepID=A0A380BRL7_SPOPA|nr:undecaprenyldiphospho-muramoylpentapeptide beta-N-acetylglucosaminyltransferase [Sporosarcina pasteurii]MDS9471227.1 undecaprenyldiphospho-muramoylpentapeptide beta-N-acetylglucosaminyltransferase [Sporosarcina pasteurii]QBQ05138.1 undecaprenyldiphospho-muramoylpentapeptide beta-N-acetylglucosaminyltransferase [Sporosarcina pasteurii]SUJ05879.1 UDP-N-acetylglucosamine--N-acetylmuramyl-(pentapeptide) pyrophosphoryl-undecaprenol N-acetylglucosamine transferase [Sporosarcina pasteurii]